MRFLPGCLLFFQALALAQGTPPMDSSQLAQDQPERITHAQEEGSPPDAPQGSAFHRMSLIIKRQINKAIDGKSCPSLDNWRPLTTREKFEVFLKRTHSPRTFAAAGIDALKDSSIRKRNPEYERGFMGFGQDYGVHLGVSETEV